MQVKTALGFLLAMMTMTASGSAGSGHHASIDFCRFYGFVPHTRAYAECRLNLQHYWTTGPCGQPEFASTHRFYCHLYPPLDF
jgi:hypothetical protein